MRYIVWVLVFGLLLAALGCSSIGTEQLSQPGVMATIQPGKSMAEIKAILGEPESKTPLPGGEIWSYSYGECQVKGSTFIPIVGLFAGGSTGKMRKVNILFGEDGTVKKVGATEEDFESTPFGVIKKKTPIH